MHFKNNPTQILSAIAIVMIIISPFFIAKVSSLQLTTTTEYTNNVYTYISSTENYTYVDKPIFPVLINQTQIPIDQNWTIICPLQQNHNYHIYCIGSWINTSSAASTDYDFYVYGPDGNLVSSHTESAGLPPHLGSSTDDPFFTPSETGNYSFVISNNPYDSKGAQQATFMIIEDLPTDQWNTGYLEGNDVNSSLYNSWAYEFTANASYFQVYVNVPSTLDVYEARLYLMSTANPSTLNSVPLPWEPGLYGNLSGSVGGYNFDSDGYRGVAYASCEYSGQPMVLSYNSSNPGLNLYHLVLIGESGSGNVQIMIKTNFANGTLTPVIAPQELYPNTPANISYTSNSTSLQQAQLTYSTDNWNNTQAIDMQISNQTCNATIPGQPAGSLVQYEIDATDTLQNSLQTTGSYTVKDPATVNITTVKSQFKYGQNIIVNGAVTPSDSNTSVQVEFLTARSIQLINCTTTSDGQFNATYKPNASGTWEVDATTNETQICYRGDSNELLVTVAPPPVYVKYSLYFIIGFAGIIGAGVAVWFLKFRGK
jgi:hypothetical protein